MAAFAVRKANALSDTSLQPKRPRKLVASSACEKSGKLSGSRLELRCFIAEMSALVGAGANQGNEPVLTLQFDDLPTLTTICPESDPAALLVTVVLANGAPDTGLKPASGELMWDSQLERPVLRYWYAAGALRDEVAVLDAVLASVDSTRAFLAIAAAASSGN